MLSMEHILNKQGITQSLRKQIASMLSATAPNRGIRCRCGKRAEWQCRPEGLQKGCSGKRHSATAPNRGKCCRCGKGAGNRPGRQPSRQTKQTKSDGTNRNRPNRRKQGRPDRKQPPCYLRSLEARRMVSTAPSMPTRSVLTTRSYSPMSVHWRPV